MDLLQSDLKSWIFTLIFGGLIFFIVKFYIKVFKYPRGPLPLPLVGSFYKFIGLKDNSFYGFSNLAKSYGSVYTFWMGPMPWVIITDLESAKEAFLDKKNQFAGRPKIKLFEVLFPEGQTDIVFGDFGPAWDNLRKVSLSAVRRWSVDDKLALLVNDVTKQTVDTIKEKEGLNNPFDPVTYIYLAVFNVLASSAFGKRYDIDDPELIKLRELSNRQSKTNGIVLIASEFIPIIKPFVKKFIDKMKQRLKGFVDLLEEKYQIHLQDYQPDIVRDFTDALIAAKFDAEKNEKESAKYLTDVNLALSLFDLFSAGSDTTQMTLRWIFLYMANYPEMQTKMRKEVEEQIGDKIPDQKDKPNCHYINAFIFEILRHRTMAPMLLPHKTTSDVTIKGIKIPKDTTISLHAYAIMHSPKVFPSPETFRPERFLESNGKFVTNRPNGFIPFGMGRRVCLGEKLALMDIFLFLVNLFQATKGYQFALPDGPGSGHLVPDPNASGGCFPLEYKLVLKEL